jgi:hypothetical protein
MAAQANKVIGLSATLFLSFGITFIDFNNLSFSENVKPYLMLFLGTVTLAYWLRLKLKSK